MLRRSLASLAFLICLGCSSRRPESGVLLNSNVLFIERRGALIEFQYPPGEKVIVSDRLFCDPERESGVSWPVWFSAISSAFFIGKEVFGNDSKD